MLATSHHYCKLSTLYIIIWKSSIRQQNFSTCLKLPMYASKNWPHEKSFPFYYCIIKHFSQKFHPCPRSFVVVFPQHEPDETAAIVLENQLTADNTHCQYIYIYIYIYIIMNHIYCNLEMMVQ